MSHFGMPSLQRLHAFIQSHRIYMQEIGFIEDARFFHGVNPAALRVMHYMSEWELSTVGQIANGVRTSHSNASHVMSDLRRKGLAACEVDGSDRRRRLYGLTPEGRRLSSSWQHHVEGALLRVVQRWPLDKQHAVGSAMVELSRLLSYPDW